MDRFDEQKYGEKYGYTYIWEKGELDLLRIMIMELCNLSDKLDRFMDRDSEGYYNMKNIINNQVAVRKGVDGIKEEVDEMSKTVSDIENYTKRITAIPEDESHYQGIHNIMNVILRMEERLDGIEKKLNKISEQ